MEREPNGTNHYQRRARWTAGGMALRWIGGAVAVALAAGWWAAS